MPGPRSWTPEMLEWLDARYGSTDIHELTRALNEAFGCRKTETAVYVKANQRGLHRPRAGDRRRRCERAIRWSQEPEGLRMEDVPGVRAEFPRGQPDSDVLLEGMQEQGDEREEEGEAMTYKKQLSAARFRAERDQARQELERERHRRKLAESAAAELETVRAENHEAAEWVRDHGGLAHVMDIVNDFRAVVERIGVEWSESELHTIMGVLDSRLMPEGMEWPLFEDNEPVAFGDYAEIGDCIGPIVSVTIPSRTSLPKNANRRSSPTSAPCWTRTACPFTRATRSTTRAPETDSRSTGSLWGRPLGTGKGDANNS